MPVLVEAHGRSYLINNPGGLMGNAIERGGAYEQQVLEHIYRKKLEGTALDVGASIGNHTLWLAAICGLRVVAFEPLDYPRLLENVALNPDLPIDVHPIGLSDNDGRGTVTGPPIHVAGAEVDSDGAVPVRPLDSLDLPDDIVLIKIDVEGMEPEVLRGGEATIERHHPVIFAEAEDVGAHGRNARVLQGWGYRHVKTFGATPLEEWWWSP